MAAVGAFGVGRWAFAHWVFIWAFAHSVFSWAFAHWVFSLGIRPLGYSGVTGNLLECHGPGFAAKARNNGLPRTTPMKEP
jgi:hypothetical protein